MGDIRKGADYPYNVLSNLSPHKFIVDDIQCESMEGFLQSLKRKKEEIQKHICTLTGSFAKESGSNINWKDKQTLYWKGKPIKRNSGEYQDLLDRAYFALAKNDSFRKALLATGNANLTHKLGRKKIEETVLTQKEFCSRLKKIRKMIKEGKL